ncbi:MAG TPA: DNA mismatch repair endonuclease MutL [Firmicutes bacterium]|nr:DNA mismatch repair endonuclease MutL [Candidatus Fermentithermobacillaceae bacterium]
MSIRRLDPALASKIAAGEVVERPASCVKELVENAIDAGARRVTVFVEGGGLELIKVSDDGAGISREDLPMALERYATSKLSDISDLENVKTLGFRGEALPSIAAVSKLTIATRRGEDDVGSLLRCQGGQLTSIVNWGGPPGTTVTVEDLFFNVPARLKFMKSKARELELISDTVTRLALAWPEIAFTLFSGKRRILETDGRGLSSALAMLFGPETAGELIPIRHGSGGVEISGFLGLPGLSRRDRSCEFFSVGKRPVRSPLFFWALDRAYSGLLREGEHPFAVVDIGLPAGSVDVNVHPQKTEIRFKDETVVRAALLEAMTSALRDAGLLQSGREFSANERPRTDMGAREWHHLSPGPQQDQYIRDTSLEGTLLQRTPLEEAEPVSLQDLLAGYEYLGILWETFVVFSGPASLVIVDQHAFYEALAYLELARDEHPSQLLLSPVTVTLDPMKVSLYEEVEPFLEQVGFTAKLVGERSVLVTGVPVVLGRAMAPEDVRAVLDGCRGRDLASVRAAVAACHSSIRAGDKLTREEVLELIRQFVAHPEVRTCPHGRPVAYRITRDEIARFFGRGG